MELGAERSKELIFWLDRRHLLSLLLTENALRNTGAASCFLVTSIVDFLYATAAILPRVLLSVARFAYVPRPILVGVGIANVSRSIKVARPVAFAGASSASFFGLARNFAIPIRLVEDFLVRGLKLLRFPRWFLLAVRGGHSFVLFFLLLFRWAAVRGAAIRAGP